MLPTIAGQRQRGAQHVAGAAPDAKLELRVTVVVKMMASHSAPCGRGKGMTVFLLWKLTAQ